MTWQAIAPAFVNYLNKEYFTEMSDRRKWMHCYRTGIDYNWINTNNFIESWHNVLKRHIFGDKHKQRIDVVMYILAKTAIPFYQKKCERHHSKSGRMSTATRDMVAVDAVARAYAQKERIRVHEIQLLNPTTDDALFKIKSFTHPLVEYDVRVDWNLGLVGHITSCTCPVFVIYTKYCKHIALAKLELEGTEFSPVGNWIKRDEPLQIEPDNDNELDAENELDIENELVGADPPDEEEPAVVGREAPHPSEVDITNQNYATEHFRFYVQNLFNLMKSMDESRPISNYQEVVASVKAAFDISKVNIKAKDEYTGTKRQRQRRPN